MAKFLYFFKVNSKNLSEKHYDFELKTIAHELFNKWWNEKKEEQKVFLFFHSLATVALCGAPTCAATAAAAATAAVAVGAGTAADLAGRPLSSSDGPAAANARFLGGGRRGGAGDPPPRGFP